MNKATNFVIKETFCETIFGRYLKGHVRYIFAILFFKLKKSSFENRKNAFYFTLKARFVLEIFKS